MIIYAIKKSPVPESEPEPKVAFVAWLAVG